MNGLGSETAIWTLVPVPGTLFMQIAPPTLSTLFVMPNNPKPSDTSSRTNPIPSSSTARITLLGLVLCDDADMRRLCMANGVCDGFHNRPYTKRLPPSTVYAAKSPLL